MNRELKFRIWKDNKMFMSGDGLLKEVYFNGNPWNEKISGILMQYTGFKDKNDRKIYEGDIVNFTVTGLTHGPEPENITNAEVYWNEEDGCWTFGIFQASFGTYGYSMLDRIDTDTFEIVGNIMEKK